MAGVSIEPIHRRDAIAAGYTDPEFRRRRRAAGWSRLRAGSYLPPGEVDAAARHRLLIAATLPAISPEAVLSHQSAVLLHGLPTWNVPLDRVHVTRDRASGGRRAPTLHVHCAPLPADHVAAADPRRCTIERAVVDLSRIAGFEASVVTGDAALRAGVAIESLLATAEYARRRHGYRAAGRALAFLDGRSESVGESRSRVLVHRIGCPPPELQLSILDERNSVVGRADFGWPDEGVLGEFDGRVKYGRLLRPGEEPGDAVFREKRREDRLRELGWTVVRWTWDDLRTPDIVRTRLHRAFAAARRTTGSVARAI